MRYLHQIIDWSIKHQPQWLVFIRVGLGLCLLAKGISFIRNSTILQTIFATSPIPKGLSWLAYFIPWAHLFGGFLIVIGLFTRIAVILQIPILIGAIIFVNTRGGVYSGGSDLFFSIIVLVLLLFFLVEGSGSYSVDRQIKTSHL
jgi:putative oxidoreductase